MIKSAIKLILCSVILTLFVKCAQVGVLTGGKRDLNPPKLIEAIPKINSVNFNSDFIELKFDEHIKLSNLKSELIISPQLNFEPEIESDGKKILISFKKQLLKPNTTYRINFGKSICDMTEGNSADNFEYVFSTGNYVDSIKIKGYVVNAFNKNVEKNIIVGLYTGIEKTDSIPYKNTPNYYCRTSDDGSFSFRNMPNNNYSVYGFSDLNKNLLYDGETEEIAFLNSKFQLLHDTTLNLKLFKEKPSKSFVKKINNPYYGYCQIIFNTKCVSRISALNYNDNKNIFEINPNNEKDTLSFYYKNLKDTLAVIIKNLTYKNTDTLIIKLPKQNTLKKKVNFSTNTTNGFLALNKKLQLSFYNWMDTTKIDLRKIHLSSKKDSVINNEQIKYRWLNISTIEITNNLKQGSDYTIKIDTAAFIDYKGVVNDSLKNSFVTKSEIEFGTVAVKLLFNKKQTYIVQLVNEQGIVSQEKYSTISLSESNNKTIDFTEIIPGSYQLKIIYDDNENKKWDTGNLIFDKQPEHVFIYSKKIKVLPDWEIEEEILIKE